MLRDRRLHLCVILNNHLIRYMNIYWTEMWHYPFPTVCPLKHKVRVVLILIYSLECVRVAGKKAAFSREWAQMCLSGLWHGGGRDGFHSWCREGNCTCVSMCSSILILSPTKIIVRILVRSKSWTNLHNTSLITFPASSYFLFRGFPDMNEWIWSVMWCFSNPQCIILLNAYLISPCTCPNLLLPQQQ